MVTKYKCVGVIDQTGKSSFGLFVFQPKSPRFDLPTRQVPRKLIDASVSLDVGWEVQLYHRCQAKVVALSNKWWSSK